MNDFRIHAPCLFGIEGVAADEFRRLGFENVQTSDGRVSFTGDAYTLARANLWSRYTERILLEVCSFRADTFDALFEGVKAADWSSFLPADAVFPVDGYSIRSRLASIPDCQRIIKKAIVSSLQKSHNVSWFPESGQTYRVRFSILGDEVCVCLDSSGDGLHKRGYREKSNAAPLRETLACAMVDLARYRGRDPFLDPFCGSGTIPIEAALKATNRAPGQYRRFDAEKWAFMPADAFTAARTEALDLIRRDPIDIEGRDIDPACVELARENARKAGVGGLIRFTQADASRTKLYDFTGTIVTNPPYGERLDDLETARRTVKFFSRQINSAAKLYVISSDEQFEQAFGRKAAKKRKLYNGMIRCNLYMYF